MATGFFGLLKDPSLVEASRQRALEMLRTTHEMFRIVVQALQEDANPPVQDKLRMLDQVVYHLAVDVVAEGALDKSLLPLIGATGLAAAKAGREHQRQCRRGHG